MTWLRGRISLVKWDHDYSFGWKLQFGRVVRGQARLEIVYVVHKRDYGW